MNLLLDLLCSKVFLVVSENVKMPVNVSCTNLRLVIKQLNQ